MSLTCINLGPETVTLENVAFWCRHARELKGGPVSKAKKLIEYGCIRYIGKDSEFGSRYCFVSLPLDTRDFCVVNGKPIPKIPFSQDYNHSGEAYKIFKNEDGVFSCNCQAWETKRKRGELPPDGVGCAHVLALFFAFKMRLFGRHEGNTEELERPEIPEVKNS